MNTLQLIAKALNANLKELFMPVRELKTVRFRSSKKMQNRENILADISRWLDDFQFLEEILDDYVPFELKDTRKLCFKNDAKAAALLCRQKLKLCNDEPIRDICGLLENAGVKVYPIFTASDSFFGLSVCEDDGGPAVVVNSWERISTERRIFSAAHELGHLVLHKNAFDVTKTEDDSEEEKQADVFAAHFIMQSDGFLKEWKETSGLLTVDRVFKIKRIFRVSYKTILSRLIELGMANKTIWGKFAMAYNDRFHRKLTFKKGP